MNKNLILGLIVAVCLAGSVEAQSSSKSHRNKTRYNNSVSTKKKQDQMDAKRKRSIVGQIQKTDFAGIKLDSAQREMLKQLVDTNYKDLVRLDSQIWNSLPSNRHKAIQSAYTKASKAGNSSSESMKMALDDTGISKTKREKVMRASTALESTMDEIRNKITMMLSDEQKKALSETAVASE